MPAFDNINKDADLKLTQKNRISLFFKRHFLVSVLMAISIVLLGLLIFLVINWYFKKKEEDISYKEVRAPQSYINKVASEFCGKHKNDAVAQIRKFNPDNLGSDRQFFEKFRQAINKKSDIKTNDTFSQYLKMTEFKRLTGGNYKGNVFAASFFLNFNDLYFLDGVTYFADDNTIDGHITGWFNFIIEKNLDCKKSVTKLIQNNPGGIPTYFNKYNDEFALIGECKFPSQKDNSLGVGYDLIRDSAQGSCYFNTYKEPKDYKQQIEEENKQYDGGYPSDYYPDEIPF